MNVPANYTDDNGVDKDLWSATDIYDDEIAKIIKNDSINHINATKEGSSSVIIAWNFFSKSMIFQVNFLLNCNTIINFSSLLSKHFHYIYIFH